eukprot:RCo032413
MEALHGLTIAGSFLMFAGYHGVLYYYVHKDPERTVFGASRRVRLLWITKMLGLEKNIINSIQTLRNSIMAASLAANSSLVLLAFLGAVLLDSQKMTLLDQVVYDVDPVFSGVPLVPVTAKLMLLVLTNILGFLLAMQSVRLHMQAGFFVGITNDDRRQWAAEKLNSVLLSASQFWTLSLRCYYLMIPLALWLFGTLQLFIASILLVFCLYYVDFSLVGPGVDQNLGVSLDIEEPARPRTDGALAN